eukprot:2268680-Prymnesium_polylepis.2
MPAPSARTDPLLQADPEPKSQESLSSDWRWVCYVALPLLTCGPALASLSMVKPFGGHSLSISVAVFTLRRSSGFSLKLDALRDTPSASHRARWFASSTAWLFASMWFAVRHCKACPLPKAHVRPTGALACCAHQGMIPFYANSEPDCNEVGQCAGCPFISSAPNEDDAIVYSTSAFCRLDRLEETYVDEQTKLTCSLFAPWGTALMRYVAAILYQFSSHAKTTALTSVHSHKPARL